ncbi:hypothetical protein EXIGLDRAFT_231944 [Exidia glandulosa HHB12029]|uniref:Retrotransposon gag domain-containing protein n=1 Tax=Exidia glandulosa HHB12029 TaxID=1314781 RepID=A0A165E3Y3_EXIGL|nr:hypothetical protein EXIGLDRAFT_231944 [Exidia glandulosa HHB12029]
MAGPSVRPARQYNRILRSVELDGFITLFAPCDNDMSQEAPGSRHCHGGTSSAPHTHTLNGPTARVAPQYSIIPEISKPTVSDSQGRLSPLGSPRLSAAAPVTDSERPPSLRENETAAHYMNRDPVIDPADQIHSSSATPSYSYPPQPLQSADPAWTALREENHSLLRKLAALENQVQCLAAALDVQCSSCHRRPFECPQASSVSRTGKPDCTSEFGHLLPNPRCTPPPRPFRRVELSSSLPHALAAESLVRPHNAAVGGEGLAREQPVTVTVRTGAAVASAAPNAPAPPNSLADDFHLRLKDLPRCNHEPDEWIHGMTSLFTSLRRPLAGVVPFIPLLLSGHAKSWFYELTEAQVVALDTWESWCVALRLGLRVQNYDAHKSHELRLRTLRRNESLADYYSARLKLQRAVMASAPDTHRIADLLAGLPVSWHAIIKAGLIGEGAHTLLAFRRVLLDLEPSLFAMRSTAEANRPSVRSSSLCRAVGDQQRRLDVREQDTKSNWCDNPRSHSATVFAQHARPVRVRPALPLITRSPSLHVRTEPRKTRRAAWYREAQRRAKTLFSCSNNEA